MMVLSSIYLSVSAFLPSTSDIKPIEVWLIFNLAFPFITILVNVILQVGIFYQNVETLYKLSFSRIYKISYPRENESS